VIEDDGVHVEPLAAGRARLGRGDLLRRDRLHRAIGIATAIERLNQQHSVGHANRDGTAFEHALLLGGDAQASQLLTRLPREVISVLRLEVGHYAAASASETGASAERKRSSLGAIAAADSESGA
jgi:hypothetical protein